MNKIVLISSHMGMEFSTELPNEKESYEFLMKKAPKQLVEVVFETGTERGQYYGLSEHGSLRLKKNGVILLFSTREVISIKFLTKEGSTVQAPCISVFDDKLERNCLFIDDLIEFYYEEEYYTGTLHSIITNMFSITTDEDKELQWFEFERVSNMKEVE